MSTEACFFARILLPSYMADMRSDEDETQALGYRAVVEHVRRCIECQRALDQKRIGWRTLPDELSELRLLLQQP